MRIYICPALMDVLIFLIMFAVMYRAGVNGFSMNQCAWLGGLFQLIYMLTSVLVGFVVSRRNARAILLFSSALGALSGAIAMMLKSFPQLLLTLGVIACCMALFFNAFQAFMRGESAPGNLRRAVGLYTFAWSLGCGAGIFSAGFFYNLGFGVLATLCIGVGIVMLAALLTHKPRPAEELSANEHVEPGAGGSRHLAPLYVWVGWVTILTAMFVQRPMHTFFPVVSAQAGVSAFLTSLPLFLQMILQAVFGLIMIRAQRLLYSKKPILFFHGGAALVALMMWLRPTLPICFAGISLLGIYAGFAYFVSVYYASNSGRRSFNIGFNEFLVGLGSFAGLFVNEWFIKNSGAATMYLVIAVAMFLAMGLQFLITGPIAKTFFLSNEARPEHDQ